LRQIKINLNSKPFAIEQESILLKIDRGTVNAINGENLSPHEVLSLLNVKAAKFGIGLCDIVEERVNGIKSRGIYETPGGTVIHSALKALKQLCWSRELCAISQVMADKYGDSP
jgi:argininosuccinate synthase